MCAVGRCLKNPENFDNILEAVAETWNSISKSFKEEYKGHNLHFWEDLQSLHDRDAYWEKNELGGFDLTESGLKHLNLMKDRYYYG